MLQKDKISEPPIAGLPPLVDKVVLWKDGFGNLERYREQLLPTAAKKWGIIRSYYYKASKLVPKNGKPYNQLAVVAVLANRKMDAVYYYVRSLAVSNPILTAREKLITIFYEIQKKV